MNSYSSIVEWFLLLPLWVLDFVTGKPDVSGPAVLIAFLTIIGLCVLCLVVFSRWKRSNRPSKFVGLFLVAIVGFPPVVFLVMVQAFGASQTFPPVNQFLAVVQTYFSLSVLTHCEAFWQRRNWAAYITAGLTTLIALVVWMLAGFCYALTLQ